MGLDVGVVQIKYLPHVDNPTYEFAKHLQHSPEEADWNGSDAFNTFVEFSRENLLEQLKEYASRNGIPQHDQEEIHGWVDGLPWDDDTIMLHLGS